MCTDANFSPLWACKKFDELTPFELYALMRLRSEVFVVEQNCVFLDADNKDQTGYHLMGWHENKLAAYARILPPQSAFNEVSIGRVASSFKYRGSGIGKKLMQQALEECNKLFAGEPVKLGAQLYLKRFYESFGFRQTSEIYLEDGIEHIEMILSKS